MADSRFPPKSTSQLEDEYKPYGQELYNFTGQAFGDNGKLLTYRDEKDALIGNKQALMYSAPMLTTK
jgi:hypothetical protein